MTAIESSKLINPTRALLAFWSAMLRLKVGTVAFRGDELGLKLAGGGTEKKNIYEQHLQAVPCSNSKLQEQAMKHFNGLVSLIILSVAMSKCVNGQWSSAHATFYGEADASGTMEKLIIFCPCVWRYSRSWLNIVFRDTLVVD
ncbi:hypothetical protein POM88_027549 [Heracleum sosnowskyi]|uniref:Uncharacterized protein n=1 Tax=Heracleum sosnowskyi TaxID=360622 RepID=A0AAD8MLK7_9APIA|nr:hypothetical protein POM88_027549 [Heracleum sosnowskyi]